MSVYTSSSIQGELNEPLLQQHENNIKSSDVRKSIFLVKDKSEKKIWQRIHSYWVSDGIKMIFIIMYILANIACFLERFLYYSLANVNNKGQYKAGLAFAVMSYGVCFARGAALALKFNCAILLIGVLRNFLSWVRGTFINDYIPIDKNIVFHRYIAWVIAFWTAIHIVAHYFNFYFVSKLEVGALRLFIPDATATLPVLDFMWTSLTGITGQIAVFCMFLMYTTAIEIMRRPNYNLFWYSHHLFIIFYAAIIFHGFQMILEQPNFWIWVAAPLALYLLERTVRIMRGSKATILRKFIQHPSKVMELQMVRAEGWSYKSGQYLFLNCPCIAGQEWHPFTISSSPTAEPYISCHIRVVGDWTGKLYKLLNPDEKMGVVREDMEYAIDGSPILKVDGPFGAASEEVFDFETVMLVGAGIGVTPFASILKTIRFEIEQRNRDNSQKPISIRKVHFYWINRDKESFEWFADLLQALEKQNIDNFLEINVFLTSRINKETDLMKLMQEDESQKDNVTGLDARTYYGRPAWNKIFSDHAEKYMGQKVGVFFCGPKILSNALNEQCKIHTKGNTKFLYHKENF